MVPDAQPWQYALPAGPESLPDFVPVRTAIEGLLPANANAFINLAYRCASTFRSTDYRGGCNGARIRFAPESEWESNAGTSDALAKLAPIKEDFPDVSYADLIVLAGIVALESENGSLDLAFCGGGVDADNAAGSDSLAPRVYATPFITVSDDCQVKGLTEAECVALASRESISSKFYADLAAGTGTEEQKVFLEGGFRAHVDAFAADEDLLVETFQVAWTKMMTADRFGGFNQNACAGVSTPTKVGGVEVGEPNFFEGLFDFLFGWIFDLFDWFFSLFSK